MSDDQTKNAVRGAIEALYKPIEGIVKTLAGPAAEEIGLSFRDSVQAWRFKRQVRLFEQVKKFCKDAGVKPQAVKLSFLFDVVDKASLEEDDTLQDMWAALLTNAADKKGEFLISSAFPDVLKQLSKKEALLLDSLILEQEDYSDTVTQRSFRGEEVHISRRKAAVVIRLPALLENNLKRLGLIEGGGRMPCVLTPFGEAFVHACQPPRYKVEKD